MPKALHDKLERSYRRRGYRGERLQRAVYGTLTNIMKHRKGNPGGSELVMSRGRNSGRCVARVMRLARQ